MAEKKQRWSRRGANAIEFALTFPVFFVILTIPMDYGWYFLQQSLVQGALRDAVRVASIQKPVLGTDPVGTCPACITTLNAVVVTKVKALGPQFSAVTAADFTVTTETNDAGCMIRIVPGTGINIKHKPLIGLAPIPMGYGRGVIGMLEYTHGCT